jgi:hypothetical protein
MVDQYFKQCNGQVLSSLDSDLESRVISRGTLRDMTLSQLINSLDPTKNVQLTGKAGDDRETVWSRVKKQHDDVQKTYRSLAGQRYALHVSGGRGGLQMRKTVTQLEQLTGGAQSAGLSADLGELWYLTKADMETQVEEEEENKDPSDRSVTT